MSIEGIYLVHLEGRVQMMGEQQVAKLIEDID